MVSRQKENLSFPMRLWSNNKQCIVCSEQLEKEIIIQSRRFYIKVSFLVSNIIQLLKSFPRSMQYENNIQSDYMYD